MDPHPPPQPNADPGVTPTSANGFTRSQILKVFSQKFVNAVTPQQRGEAFAIALQFKSMTGSQRKWATGLWVVISSLSEMSFADPLVGSDASTAVKVPREPTLADLKALNLPSFPAKPRCYAVSPYKVPEGLVTPPGSSEGSDADWVLKMIKEESKVDGWVLLGLALQAYKLRDHADGGNRQEEYEIYLQLLYPFHLEQLMPVLELIDAQRGEVKKFLRRMAFPGSMATLEAWIKTK